MWKSWCWGAAMGVLVRVTALLLVEVTGSCLAFWDCIGDAKGNPCLVGVARVKLRFLALAPGNVSRLVPIFFLFFLALRRLEPPLLIGSWTVAGSGTSSTEGSSNLVKTEGGGESMFGSSSLSKTEGGGWRLVLLWRGWRLLLQLFLMPFSLSSSLSRFEWLFVDEQHSLLYLVHLCTCVWLQWDLQ